MAVLCYRNVRNCRSTARLLRAAQVGRRVYWRLLKPTTLGSLCLVVRGDRVLLLRHVYEGGWHLPGGGVKRGESFAQAARREVREEVGLRIGALRLLSVYHNRTQGKSDHVAVFVATEWEGEPSPRSAEIGEVAWSPLTEPPPDTTPATRRRLAEYVAGTSGDRW